MGSLVRQDGGVTVGLVWRDTDPHRPSEYVSIRAELPDGCLRLTGDQQTSFRVVVYAGLPHIPCLLIHEGSTYIESLAQAKEVAQHWYEENYPLHALAGVEP